MTYKLNNELRAQGKRVTAMRALAEYIKSKTKTGFMDGWRNHILIVGVEQERDMLVEFLDWMNTVVASNPMALETDADDIVDMFLNNYYNSKRNDRATDTSKEDQGARSSGLLRDQADQDKQERNPRYFSNSERFRRPFLRGQNQDRQSVEAPTVQDEGAYGLWLASGRT